MNLFGIDPSEIGPFLINILLSLPAFLIALTFHEAAHAYAANKLGDPTAKMLGRLTLNPLAHLDVLGLLMLIVARIGWAKPVPVNPRYYKHPRRDDLIVSVAGIATNFALFLITSLVLTILVTIGLRASPLTSPSDLRFVFENMLSLQPLAAEFFGDTVGYLYAILANIALYNLLLAVFNLIPLPPLDGYHLFNGLILNRSSLFASRNASIVSFVVLIALQRTGILSTALNFVISGASKLLGGGAYMVAHALGLL